MKTEYVLILLIIIILLMVWKRQSIKNIVAKLIIRPEDKAGSGKFGASRGDRKHLGIDILTDENEPVYAPFDMVFKRHAYPYSDKSYDGALYETDTLGLKIFYMSPNVKPGLIKKGDVIGYSQNISSRYPDAKNHIHLELRDRASGALLDPSKYI